MDAKGAAEDEAAIPKPTGHQYDVKVRLLSISNRPTPLAWSNESPAD